MEFIKTQKGGEALIWDGAKFTLNRDMENGTKYWRCGKRSCPARITTDGTELLQQTNGHNHAIDGVEAQIDRVKDRLKKRAREEITPIPTIYNDTLVDIARAQDVSVAARLPTYPSMKSALYRARSSRLPSLPQSREDIHLEGRWQLTLSGEQFLIRDAGDAEKMLIFATEESLHQLAEAEIIYVDGTFEVCPRLFYQVFTINAFRHGQQFPLVYGLLPSKSRESYNRFFMAVKEEAMDRDVVFAQCTCTS